MNAPRSGCPINLTLEALGDRWSLIVIRDRMTNCHLWAAGGWAAAGACAAEGAAEPRTSIDATIHAGVLRIVLLLVKGAPLKLAVSCAIGVVMGGVGGFLGQMTHRHIIATA